MKLIKKLIHRALGIEVVSALRQPQADREHEVRTVKPKDGSTYLAQHPSLWDDVIAMVDSCIKAVRKLWTIPTPKRVSQGEIDAACAAYDAEKAEIKARYHAVFSRQTEMQEHLDLTRRREELLGEMSLDTGVLRESIAHAKQLAADTQLKVLLTMAKEQGVSFSLTNEDMERLLIGIKECKSRARANQLWDRALATYVPEHTDPKLKEILQEVADARLRQFAAEDAAAARAKKPVLCWGAKTQSWYVGMRRNPSIYWHDPQLEYCVAKLNLLNQKGKR